MVNVCYLVVECASVVVTTIVWSLVALLSANCAKYGVPNSTYFLWEFTKH
jgi:hypothetical protein